MIDFDLYYSQFLLISEEQRDDLENLEALKNDVFFKSGDREVLRFIDEKIQKRKNEIREIEQHFDEEKLAISKHIYELKAAIFDLHQKIEELKNEK